MQVYGSSTSEKGGYLKVARMLREQAGFELKDQIFIDKLGGSLRTLQVQDCMASKACFGPNLPCILLSPMHSRHQKTKQNKTKQGCGDHACYRDLAGVVAPSPRQ